MSWVNPRTWAGDGMTSAKMNEIRDVLRWSSGDRTTSVPGSPNDGDEFIYPADTTNGVMWKFKYRAASGSTYKWEFVGGAPMVARVDTDESSTGAPWVDIGTVGPSITLPRSGDYVAIAGATAWVTVGSGQRASAAIKRGAAAASANDTIVAGGVVNQFDAQAYREYLLTGMSAGDVVKIQYGTTGGATGHWSFRFLSILPARIS